MKKTVVWSIAIAVFFILAACGGTGNASSWQEQYDLGMRYLSEGNYEEAIIAFTTAIEIDPKQAPAYVGRGNAYFLSGPGEENLSNAQADFEKALELDNTLSEAWLGLANVLIQRGDIEGAIEILRQALTATNDNPSIQEALEEQERAILKPLFDRVEEHVTNGEYEQAIAALEDALDQLGESKAIQDKLTEVEQIYEWATSGRTITYVHDADEFKRTLAEAPSHAAVLLDEGSYRSDSLFSFENLEDVIIQGTGSTQLLIGSGYDPVVSIYNCKDLILRGVIVGHDIIQSDAYDCEGGVISVRSYSMEGDIKPSNVRIENCDLFGCGLLGIGTAFGTEVYLQNTTIRDCSQMIAQLGGKAEFVNCSFTGNAYARQELIEAGLEWQTSDKAISAWSEPAVFTDCVFENNMNPMLTGEEDRCEFNNCTFIGNAWDT